MSDTPSAPISHLNVWPVGDELVVTWRGGGPAINVFVSDDPIDAGTRARVRKEKSTALFSFAIAIATIITEKSA